MEIGICFLHDYPDYGEALRKTLGVSRSGLKKYFPRKSWPSPDVKLRDSVNLPLDLVNWNVINGEYAGEKIEILDHDENFLVMNKPPNLHCHPLKYTETHNCLSFLRSSPHFRVLEINPGLYDRGLLYRLDYETSGVLVYVLKEDLLLDLRQNFRSRVKRKIYLAMVEGNFQREGRHGHFLKPSGPKGKKMRPAQKGEEGAQWAELLLEKWDYSPSQNLSLLKVDLLTGVRHQIRAQLSLLNHPLVGDSLYGGKEAQRIFLHALHYELELPHNLRTYSFQSPKAPLFDQFFSFE